MADNRHRMSRPSSAAIARIYSVHPRQLARWKAAGFNILDPVKLAESLAAQHRPGETLDRLLAPGELERTSQLIHKLLTPSKS
jgi:hypothetical protein